MKEPKKRQEYYCEICEYKCIKLSDWKRHCSTAKHKNWTKLDKTGLKNAEQNTAPYRCECGKVYKAKSSFYYHKKKCSYHEKNKEIINNEKEKPNYKEEPNYKDLLIDAMKQMQQKDELVSEAMKEMTEMRKQMTNMMPLIGNNNNITTNTNNTTNHFNLNLFLNEKCKDALNLTDFINSLQVQLKDLEYTAENGHIQGITNIFHNALSKLEETKRPLHCTDLKREVLYIKDNNEWHKDENKQEIKVAVNKVVNKNIGNQAKWIEAHPNLDKEEEMDNYIRMQDHSLGTGEEIEQNKIVKNILKEVTIEKNEK
tara:strand:- start:589 stop:1527 length:939 start_codon:yes stop_codon:yes gene_type:complete